MPKTIAGIVDRLTQNSVVGWARNPKEPGVSVKVNFYLNGSKNPFYSLQANRPHGGLEFADIAENHGFSSHWPKPLKAGDTVLAAVLTAGKKLYNTPITVDHVQNDPCLYSSEHSYLIYYNFKSACTLVRELFIHLHAGEVSADQHPIGVDAARIAFLPPDELVAEEAGGLSSIVVVRNPYYRVLSMFLDKVVSWCYEPELCYGHEVFEHYYGDDTARYTELTFADFLLYLRDNVLSANMHFRKQPLIEGTDAVWRVESLQEDIQAYYRSFRPQLLPQVQAFFSARSEHANASLNSRQKTHSDLYLEIGRAHV